MYEVGGGIGLAGFASNDFCAPPILEEFDTAGRIAYARPGLGLGDPFSMAIDHGPDVVAVANSCSADFGLYNLATGQSSLVDLGQNGSASWRRSPTDLRAG
ncbi:MAG: hypothetical protein M3O94_07360 [Actinomycetota bacterium]|nr:hypothetical protein [Actinomycetota bacterium]